MRRKKKHVKTVVYKTRAELIIKNTDYFSLLIFTYLQNQSYVYNSIIAFQTTPQNKKTKTMKSEPKPLTKKKQKENIQNRKIRVSNFIVYSSKTTKTSTTMEIAYS